MAHTGNNTDWSTECLRRPMAPALPYVDESDPDWATRCLRRSPASSSTRPPLPDWPSIPQTDATCGTSAASRLMRPYVSPSNFDSDGWKRWLADVVPGAPPAPAPRLLPIAFAAVSARS
jgi:hypothetical protein